MSEKVSLQDVIVIVQLHSILLAGIGGQDADPSAIRHDDTVLSGRERRIGKVLTPLQRFFQALRPENVGLSHEMIEHLVRTGQGSRMGGRGNGPSLRAARLHDDHRLLLRRPLEGADKTASFLETLDVDHDHLRRFVIQEMFQAIRLTDVRLISNGDDGRKSYVFDRRLSDHRNPEGSALGDDGNISRSDGAGTKGRIQRTRRRKDAEDIGPQHTHAALPRIFDDLSFFLPVTDFRESGGDDHVEFDLLQGTAFHRIENVRGRHDDASDVYLAFNVGHVPVSPKPEDLSAPGVHRINLSRIAARDDVIHDLVADLTRVLRRSDDRNGSWFKQIPNIRFVHLSLIP